jgi:hypothetical protein
MGFTSILVIIEVIFEFYWKKILCKGNILRARAGPAGPSKFIGLGRVGLENSSGRAGSD